MFVALQNLGCGTSLFDLTRCLWRPPETTRERQVDGADTAKALQTQSITVMGNSGHYVINISRFVVLILCSGTLAWIAKFSRLMLQQILCIGTLTVIHLA
jgi:hypothetical protein